MKMDFGLVVSGNGWAVCHGRASQASNESVVSDRARGQQRGGHGAETATVGVLHTGAAGVSPRRRHRLGQRQPATPQAERTWERDTGNATLANKSRVGSSCFPAASPTRGRLL